MPHLTRIELRNYRSFLRASCQLCSFTLVVGKNNSGKTNFLRAFQDFADQHINPDPGKLQAHSHYQQVDEHGFEFERLVTVRVSFQDGSTKEVDSAIVSENQTYLSLPFPFPEIYDFDPRLIGAAEPAESPEGVKAKVLPDGRGVTSVLRQLALGNADQKRRFDRIRHQWQECLPEIHNLHFASSGPTRLMVEQDAIPGSRPLSDLSEGARLLLAMLTLVHQDPPPHLILLEDFDHKLHSRLFASIVGFLRDLTCRTNGPQIIATTHNPYLVDEFKDEPEAVVIVEKHEGRSTLANLDDRLRTFLEEGEPPEMPLGQILFSGLADAPPPVRLDEIPRP